jgi:hypothetical protein
MGEFLPDRNVGVQTTLAMWAWHVGERPRRAEGL